jgi:hypothetical protein
VRSLQRWEKAKNKKKRNPLGKLEILPVKFIALSFSVAVIGN